MTDAQHAHRNSPLGMARRAAGSFTPGAMPASIRRNYARELPGTAMLSIGRSAFDGAIVAGVTRVAYDGVIEDTTLNLAVAALSTAPAAANVVNFIWARLAQGVNKTKFISWLQWGMVGSVIAMAAMPATPAGLIGLIVCTFAAWVFWSGFVSTRSTIWRANYARGLRARVAGKLSTVQTLILGVAGLALGAVMGDKLRLIFGTERLSLASLGIEPLTIFRCFLVVSALIAASAIGILAGIRVRQQKRLLAAERESTAENTGPTLNPVGIARLLLEDRRYGAYQVFQFLMGIGNLMVFPLLPIILRERFDADYLTVLLLSSSIAMLVVPFAVPLWAKLLDGVHIVRFRAFHSWVFVMLIALLLTASLGQMLWLFYVVALLKGVAMGGGMLAWQLGHHDFAPPDRAGEYMGVHVTLTGVRGLIGPVLIVWLYNTVDGVAPAWSPAVLGLSLVLVLIGAIGFNWMNRVMDLTPVDDRAPADSKTQGPAPVSRAEA